MADIIGATVVLIGTLSMIALFIAVFRDLTGDAKVIAQFVGLIALIFVLGNVGKALGFWGS
jgi:uncharacterized membrane protein